MWNEGEDESLVLHSQFLQVGDEIPVARGVDGISERLIAREDPSAAPAGVQFASACRSVFALPQQATLGRRVRLASIRPLASSTGSRPGGTSATAPDSAPLVAEMCDFFGEVGDDSTPVRGQPRRRSASIWTTILHKCRMPKEAPFTPHLLRCCCVRRSPRPLPAYRRLVPGGSEP